jgi:putative Mn2+ efflux pump MntP
LQVDSYAGRWIGFQIFCGIGFAMLVQTVSLEREK